MCTDGHMKLTKSRCHWTTIIKMQMENITVGACIGIHADLFVPGCKMLSLTNR